MRVLFRNVKLCFPGDEAHGRTTDLFLDYNKVGAVGDNLEEPHRTKVLEGGILAPGFVDIGTFSGEPGFEQRENLNTLKNAAARGGYTHLFVLPNLHPITDNLAAVRYLQNKSGQVAIHALGAVSQATDGEDLAEIYDMNSGGVRTFTDGLHPVNHVGLMKRALQYVRSFNGLVMNMPFEKTIEPDGRIHENAGSMQMGMKGIPEISEQIMLKRDIELLEYTESRLLSHQISSEKSLRLLKTGKKDLPELYASVAFLNLVANSGEVQKFDTNYLVMPPLREESDRQALIRGLKEGTLDCIVSGHMPVEEEWKKIEFAHAEYGASTLPFVFPVLYDRLKKQVSLEQLMEWLSVNPRRIMGMPVVAPEEGQEIDFVWIDPEGETSFNKKNYPSKSKNTPFLDRVFTGGVKGVFYQEAYQLFD